MNKFVLLCFLLLPFSLTSAQDIKEKVDSLFIQASAGEEKYWHLIEPSKKALIEMGKDAVPYLVEKLITKDAREILTLIDILGKMGEDAVLPLIEVTKSENKDKVKTATRCLGEIKSKTATPALLELLNNPDWNIRQYTCASLGKIGDTSALNNLFTMLKDPNEIVRKSTAVALGDIKDESAIPVLISALNDDFFGTRMAAAEALVKFDSIALPQLTKLLRTEKGIPKYLALEVLGKIKHPQAAGILLNSLYEKDPYVRAACVEGLGNFKSKLRKTAILNLQKIEKHPLVKRKIEETLEKL